MLDFIKLIIVEIHYIDSPISGNSASTRSSGDSYSSSSSTRQLLNPSGTLLTTDELLYPPKGKTDEEVKSIIESVVNV